jgi:hypothetical protein
MYEDWLTHRVERGRASEALAADVLTAMGLDPKLTPHHHNVDILVGGWAFEVRTVSPKSNGIYMHRHVMQLKAAWAAQNGYKLGVCAVNLDTRQVRWYPRLTIVHWNDMSELLPDDLMALATHCPSLASARLTGPSGPTGGENEPEQQPQAEA